MSRLRSATSCLSLRFSSSSCRSRLTSGVPRSPYFAFHRKNVAWLMPNFRHVSSAPSPASACLRAKTICSVVNFDFFMALSSSGLMASSYPKSQMRWSRNRGACHEDQDGRQAVQVSQWQRDTVAAHRTFINRSARGWHMSAPAGRGRRDWAAAAGRRRCESAGGGMAGSDRVVEEAPENVVEATGRVDALGRVVVEPDQR